MGNELAEQGQGNIAQFGVGGVSYMQQHYQMLVDATRAVLRKDVDYGVIPGTGTKPVLYKPGAEKLCLLFSLQPVFEVTDRVLNWDAPEPFFFYEYKCKLYHRGVIVGEGDGSCNSHESKYRWRKGERVCPNCGQPAIIKGRAEYGGGWLCYTKKGGCGAKFAAGDPAIEGQEVGRIPNPDVADVVNTVQKMAQKRALVAAVLVTTGASEFYTQDLEDYVDGSYTEVEDKPQPQAAKHSPQEFATKDGKPYKNLTLDELTVIKEAITKAKDTPGRTLSQETLERLEAVKALIKAKDTRPQPEREDDSAGRAAVAEMQAEADAEGEMLTPPMF